MLLAFYAGMGECRDDQSVYVIYIKNGSFKFRTRIGNLTGNPVLWAANDQRAVLLYSRFEDSKRLKRLVDRWKYCSLWITTIVVTESELQFTQPIRQPLRPHLLGRCIPLRLSDTQDTMLLPLYDEVHAKGVIYSVEDDRTTLRNVGDFGERMIQPTLWVADETTNPPTISALSRNFGNNRHFASVCNSSDRGATWSSPLFTDITNNNSSLHACTLNGTTYLLWNATTGKLRINLTLGKLRFIDKLLVSMPISVISEYGHYPSMVAHEEKLHFTFTNQQGEIEYHEWDEQRIAKAQKATEEANRRNLLRGIEPDSN